MNVLEAIKGRRSIRAFKSTDVAPETVKKLIAAARRAPSAGNIQPWEFVIIRKQEIKRRLVEAALDQTFIEEAPVVIVACANENRSSEGYGVRGKTLYCIQDTAAAIQNILLAAHSLGLGTCWVGHVLGWRFSGRRGERNLKDSQWGETSSHNSAGFSCRISLSAR